MMDNFWPRTRIGWVAAVSFWAFMVLYIINGYMLKATASSQWWLDEVLPTYGNALLVTVVVASFGSVIAWLWVRDDAWAVRIATVPIWAWLSVRILIAVITALGL